MCSCADLFNYLCLKVLICFTFMHFTRPNITEISDLGKLVFGRYGIIIDWPTHFIRAYEWV